MLKESCAVSVFGKYAKETIKTALLDYNEDNNLPIIVCIGSDLVLGDSLGPLVGTFLKQKGVGAYIYGTLNAPITAKEIDNIKIYLKKVHPNSAVIAVDAAVGGESDVGIIKINPFGLKPGLGVDKDLSIIGDISIVGVVASRSIRNENLFNLTRLNFVYKMAGVIAGGIEEYIKRYSLYNNSVSVI
ncbi:MAG: spore protease YyaC [Clostridia bacterium]|nr:spore protease YyaC [Clostridia bacterium]